MTQAGSAPGRIARDTSAQPSQQGRGVRDGRLVGRHDRAGQRATGETGQLYSDLALELWCEPADRTVLVAAKPRVIGVRVRGGPARNSIRQAGELSLL